MTSPLKPGVKTGGHTPGPWSVSVVPALSGGRTATYRLDNLERDARDRENSWETGRNYRYFNPETEYPANARLIAAAPDLLEALKEAEGLLIEAQDALVGRDDVCMAEDGSDAIAVWREKTRAALSKASGGAG